MVCKIRSKRAEWMKLLKSIKRGEPLAWKLYGLPGFPDRTSTKAIQTPGCRNSRHPKRRSIL
jgi:hypothetical protein